MESRGILPTEVEAVVRLRFVLTAFAVAMVACSLGPERNLIDTSSATHYLPKAPYSPKGPYSSEVDPSAADADAVDTSTADGGAVFKVPVGTSPVRGPSDAWVTIVEFGDFQCPYCGAEEPVLNALLFDHPSDLRLVFKQFPLTAIHRYAEGAAIAAECAAEQGAFWLMHDLLFSNQGALESADLLNYAQAAGVDVTSWQQCLSTQPPRDAIGVDVVLGNSVAVDGTPTFFVNGLRIVGAVEASHFKPIISEAEASAQASGVPSGQYYNTVILGQ